jgi:NADP oxidoreductase coenzyme F420-dependent
MSIGIIGAGNIGLAVATTLARAGVAATIANSRGPDSLTESVRHLSTIEATTREEAASADIVLIAVNWSKLRAALAGLPAWDGRIVVDANNPVEAPLFKPVDLQGLVSSQVVAGLVSGARVVKAFNHLRAEVLASDPRPSRAVLLRRRCCREGGGRGADRPRRLCRHRPWSPPGRRQTDAVSRRTATEPKPRQDRLIPSGVNLVSADRSRGYVAADAIRTRCDARGCSQMRPAAAVAPTASMDQLREALTCRRSAFVPLTTNLGVRGVRSATPPARSPA